MSTMIEYMEGEIVNENKNLVLRKTRNPRTYTKRTLFEGKRGRRLLWDGLGSNVSSAHSAYEVCKLAGLDYTVKTESIFTEDGIKIPNMIATRRYDMVDGVELPSTVYGAVSNRYVPVQNSKGFEVIDSLFLHQGFEVETAGQFDNGKIVWVEARLPEKNIAGEKIDPYIVFTNRHDGKGSVRIFLTPVRIICKNTLNYAIKGAQGRGFSVKHLSTANAKLDQAKEILNHYKEYLSAMEKKIEDQKRFLLTDDKVDNFLSMIFKMKEEDSITKKETILVNRREVKDIYENAPDLDGYERSAFRFINAVSDWSTHHIPHRQTANYNANLFQKTLEGNEYIDAAVDIIDEYAYTEKKLIA